MSNVDKKKNLDILQEKKIHTIKRIPTLEEIKQKNKSKYHNAMNQNSTSKKESDRDLNNVDKIEDVKKRFARGVMNKRLLVRSMMNILAEETDYETRNKDYLKPKEEQVD
ncbi:hypothetical protein [Candidatus Lokiarchaeum ossiferum]|uniref:hypothetical protein n=1 Tax=Candidatus Lokiarchaeum ossiferum TaxID=2951803 RepID=UPI00352C65ED